jgi:hypothetical protein
MLSKKQGCLSAIAAGLVTIAGNSAAAGICLTQPNLRADGGHWYYRIDRPTQRKCWYQQTSRTEARRASSPPAPPPSSAKSRALSTSRANEPEGSRVQLASPRSATVGLTELDAGTKGIDQADLRTRGINADNGRATQVDPDGSPLNRFDWDGMHARSAISLTKGDRLLPKVVPTVAAPPTPPAPSQVSVPVQMKASVSALDAARLEALFQEFLRWQDRRFW